MRRRTLRYVELLSEARTPLADFFSILLEKSRSWVKNHTTLTNGQGHNVRIWQGRRSQIRHSRHIVTELAKELNGTGSNVEIRQKPHRPAKVCSLASQAPYFAAWYTSSSWSSGYSRVMSSAVNPLPKSLRTKSTVKRRPRMVGLPLQTAGSI
jgi:hypothetical protein